MPDLAVTSAGNLPTASTDKVQALRKAAAQLESVFLRELMKPMEEDSLSDGDPLVGGTADKEWKRLQLDALAEQGAGSIGLADVLVRELSLKTGGRP